MSLDYMDSPQNNVRAISVFSINLRMLPSKIVYFFSYAFAGCYVPFINVFSMSLGLSVMQAGCISGVRLIAIPFASPIWCFIADRTGHRKLVFIILCLGTAFTIFAMPWSAREIIFAANPSLKNSYFSVGNHEYGALKSIKPFAYNNTEAGSPDNNEIIWNGLESSLNFVKTGDQKTSNETITRTIFYTMVTLSFVSSIFFTPLNALIDSFVKNVARNQEHVSFSQQRMPGSISYGLCNLLAAITVDHYSDKIVSKYTAIFWVFLPFVLLLIPAGLGLFAQTKWQPSEQRTKCINRSNWVSETFSRVDNLLFLSSVFILGIASGVLIGYLFVLMEYEMNASVTMMGLSVFISSISKVIVFPLSHRIILLLGGPIPAIEIAMVSYSIRFILISYIGEPYFILPTQLFHGLCYVLFWAGVIEYTQSIAPKEIYTTMFRILSTTYYCLGGLVGNLGGGAIYKNFNGRMLFRATGILCGLWSVILFLYFHAIARSRKAIHPNIVSQPVQSESVNDNSDSVDVNTYTLP